MLRQSVARRTRATVRRVGSYRLLTRETGSGQPLVLIHGLSGSSRWWRRNIPALAQHFCVQTVDLLGYGGNWSIRPARIEQTADHIAAYIADLPAGRAHVIGHSMGGHIATYLAARHPERVDRLVLASASGLVRSNLIQMALRLPGAGRYSRLDFMPTLTMDALRAGPVNLLLSTLDILASDVTSVLGTIVAPTLLVWGDHDRLVPDALGEALHRAIVGSQYHVIKNAGHVVMWDQPDEFNRVVLDFLLAPARSASAQAATISDHGQRQGDREATSDEQPPAIRADAPRIDEAGD